MPSSMTHSYFAIDVYNKLNNLSKHKIDEYTNRLKTYALGTDPYMFYNLFIGKKNKKSSNIQKMNHTTKTKDYFVNMINYIINNNLENNKDIISYLYGSICHYFLDKTIHPFIFYKTGLFNKNDKTTYKYNGLHAEMEYYIDFYMIYNREKTIPKNYKFYKDIFNIDKLSIELSKMIDYIMKKTYGVDNSASIYIKSLKHMYIFNKIFNYDKTGIKKKIYKLIDYIQSNKFIRKEELSFNIEYNKKIHYLNLDKKKWNHPCDINESYNYSFIELYMIALNKCVDCINNIITMIDNKKIYNKIISKYFDNSSYLTGKDCNDNKKIQYFEF